MTDWISKKVLLMNEEAKSLVDAWHENRFRNLVRKFKVDSIMFHHRLMAKEKDIKTIPSKKDTWRNFVREQDGMS